MALSKGFTIVSFPIRRDLYTRLKLKHPKYGEISKVLRTLVQQLLDGKVRIKDLV